MKISGFTIGKNVSKLYYPVKESISSILPIVDEFIVLLGDCDPDDTTRQEILSIGNDKIKIFDSVWDIEKYSSGTELAHQTDIAKKYCSGDWLFYIQADEVIHEKHLPVIKKCCEDYLNDSEVEGILFNYLHFWGDYNHYQASHGWYKKEIRIIKNNPDIHSWRDAQSFRKIPDFDGLHYMQKMNTYKLKVVDSGCNIFHYGWVRPPTLLKVRLKSFFSLFIGKEGVEKQLQQNPEFLNFDYGPLNKLAVFKNTHPKVMENWIAKLNWQNELQLSGKPNKNRRLHKHELFRYRFVTFIEMLFGTPIWEFKNYIILKRKKGNRNPENENK
jgi:hypothetical protein